MIDEINKEVPDTDEQELLSWDILLHGRGKAVVGKDLPIELDTFYGYEHVSFSGSDAKPSSFQNDRMVAV